MKRFITHLRNAALILAVGSLISCGNDYNDWLDPKPTPNPSSSGITLTLTPIGASAFGSTTDYHTTATITAVAEKDGVTVAIGSNPVTWTVVNSSITAAWWGDSGGRLRSPNALNGLAWGTTPISLSSSESERTDMSGNGNGTSPTYASPDTGDTATLTDIVGSRQVELQAEVSIGGETYTGTTTVNFGAGPLSVFRGAPLGSKTWTDAGAACGAAGDPADSRYQPSTKLPTQEQLQAVAGGTYGKQGAAHAAGWRDDTTSGVFSYWTGEIGSNGVAQIVHLDDGNDGSHNSLDSAPVAVCLL
ncbi:hypothetical protein FACS189487_06010 [Campylobacterota bacterium]|nr:hypothetical protein FACS189487_06010 [Campylobacterota bacterium]